MSYYCDTSAMVSLDRIDEILDWTKVNCPSYITNTSAFVQEAWCYRFHFGDEQDAALFALRWS